MVIAVDGEVVLSACWPDEETGELARLEAIGEAMQKQFSLLPG